MYKEIILSLLKKVLPFIENLIQSKIVPVLKRKAYESLDEFANERIEDLMELLEKIKSEDDFSKKQRRLEGFILGIETLEAIGKKLVESSEVLKKEIE